jgi:cysteinyl-tRNA synthetase
MDDDFNSPGGLVILFELAKELRKEGNVLTHQGTTPTASDTLKSQWQTLVCLAQVLGLAAQPDTAKTRKGLSDQAIEALITQRQAARQAKNYRESDRIRDQLKAQGITLIDQAGGGIRWHRD